MVDFLSRNPETSETQKQPEASQEGKAIDTKEIKEASKEFVEGVSEVVEGVENAEVVDGEVNETTGEDKKKGPQGSMKGGSSTQTAVKKDTKIPSIEIMQIQIATQIKKEIRILEKEIRSLESGRKFNPMKLSMAVARVRTLRDILANLAHVAAETVKNWWQELVMGHK